MALRGTDALITAATTTGGTYNTVEGLTSFKMGRKGNNIDITTLGKDYVTRFQGLKDITYSLSGLRLTSDTTGQGRILTAWEDGSELHIKVLPDGTNGHKQQVVVSSFDEEGSADSEVGLSIELEGSDTITAIP